MSGSNDTGSSAMRVVSDAQINKLLLPLKARGVEDFQRVLYTALAKYHDDPTLIPERIVVNRPELDAVHFFMPTFSDRVGIKTLGGSKKGFEGAVMIMDENTGILKGVLSARAITGFRTALCSTIPLMKFIDRDARDQVMTVFGNGLQAYWHVKLTLELFPSYFKKVQIAVRSVNDKSKELLDRLQNEYPQVEFTLDDEKEVDLSTSNVIYGCVPSTEPRILFDKLGIDNHKVFISIIGSYKPHMFEVDDKIVQTAMSNGKIIVDSYDHTLHEAGELIKNNVTPQNCVEIGELENLTPADINGGSNLTLSKIVGLAIMDISVGNEILERAEKLDIGTVVEF